MSDAAVARTYEGSVDTQSVDATYVSAAVATEAGKQVTVAVSKSANITVDPCVSPPVTLNTSEAVQLDITRGANQLTVHFNVSTLVDVDYKNCDGTTSHFSAGVAIQGDFTLKFSTTTNYCDAVQYACGQLKTQCGNPCDSGGKITVSCAGFDLSAITSYFFSDPGSSGATALILDHNKVTDFQYAATTDGDSLASAIATWTGALALGQTFPSSGADPFQGFTPLDILMLKVLGGDAAAISADPSRATALLSTLVATYTGAALALDYTWRALAVLDAMPTDLALNAASDGGAKGDGLTNDRTVTIDGQAGAGDTITLFDGTRAVGTAVVGSNGVFHVTSSSLADGVHTLTAVATNGDGVKVASDPFQVTIDGTLAAPKLTDASASGVAGTAEAGSKVAVYDAGKLVGTVVTGADGHWTLARAITDTATHSYTAVATDAAGNSDSSDGAAFLKMATGSLTGGSGDDLLVVRNGQVVTGGYGRDHFVFDGDSGKATIADFNHGTDVIDIDHSLAANWGAVKSHAAQKGYDVVITLDPNHVLTLKNVTLSSLTSSDFVFS